MDQHDTGRHDPVRSSRQKTGMALLVGCLMLGLGFGLALSHLGIGLMIGAGTWLITVSTIRVYRGL